MKRILIVTICLLSAYIVTANAQILHPVKWSYAAKRISKTEAIVFLKATIDPAWHLYSQTVKEGGPVKTSFSFKSIADYTLIGETIEPKPITKFEKVFNMDVSYFENSVVFQQKIKLKKRSAVVKGSLNYMTCNDHQCLPPEDIDFSVVVK